MRDVDKKRVALWQTVDMIQKFVHRLYMSSNNQVGIDLVEQRGQLLCRVAEQLTDAEADVAVPTLIISNDEVMLDSPLPLRGLIDGLTQVHLPRHAEQLAALAA